MAEEMDDDVINEYLIQTTELVEDLSQKFVELEQDTTNQGIVDCIFRSVHSVKGASGFFGFNQMVELTHLTESVMKKIKDGEIALTSSIMNVLLGSLDMVKVLLERIRARDEGHEDLTGIMAQLQGVYDQAGAASKKPEAADSCERAPSLEDLEALMEAQSKKMISQPTGASLGEILVNDGTVTKQDLDEALKIQGIINKFAGIEAPKLGEILTVTEKASEQDVKNALSKQQPADAKKAAAHQPDQTIRVDVVRLDSALNLTGELVLARNRLVKIASKPELMYVDNANAVKLSELTAFIDVITTDLQLALMKTRMQPVKRVFSKFPRMVRDLAMNMNKQVKLTLAGEETELDKSIIEEIGDPLLHLVRNSVDHGIEMPDVRESIGKPIFGTVVLSAYQEGNDIVLSISDDGKGIDEQMLREKIVEKGLASADDVKRLSRNEVLDYIFMPGFSTAKVVSDVSGRGVGMDVVRTNIKKLNGSITIDTEKGKGTRFLLKLPLTLAIIQVLMVGVGDDLYAVPLASVVEIVCIKESDLGTAMSREVINLRNEIVPVSRLAAKFAIHMESSNGGGNDESFLVVMLIGEKKCGMVVDKLFGQEEVVIKPIKGIPTSVGITGATITGDGDVVLIIDPVLLFADDLRQ
ncbi:MAG: chemotaxis protein CheA [Candidatus Magnetominusculus sp. LBB02]|nr:chemotaxis protein CheA [Candidatus Magnetominusculus sp. LBB02]